MPLVWEWIKSKHFTPGNWVELPVAKMSFSLLDSGLKVTWINNLNAHSLPAGLDHIKISPVVSFYQ